MKYDCGFEKGNNWFRYRTGGIIIHNNKMLFVKSCISNYYYMLGGGVHLGETSEKCIEREVFEETGIHARADRLAVVCENFFKGFGGKIDGLDCHTIEFYYHMKILDDVNLCKKVTDDGEELVWIPIDEIKDSKIKGSVVDTYPSLTNADVVTFNGNIYTYGGSPDGSKRTNSIYCYNVASNTLYELDVKIANGSTSHRALLHQGKVYIFD